MECLENKRYVYTFATTPLCEFNHYDLLVFSFLGYMSRYQNKWSFRQIARRTGMDEGTASAAVERLASFDLVDDGSAILPPERADWFVWKRKSKETVHFSLRIAGYNNYVRRTSSPLTVIAHSLYSYLLHCKESKWQPGKGHTVSYLAEVLSCSPATIREATEQLVDHYFLRYEDATWMLYKTLHPEQIAFFLDADDYASAGGIVELNEAPPIEARSKIFDEMQLTQQINRSPMELEIEKYLKANHPNYKEYYPELPVKVFNWIGSHQAMRGTLDVQIKSALDEILQVE